MQVGGLNEKVRRGDFTRINVCMFSFVFISCEGDEGDSGRDRCGVCLISKLSPSLQRRWWGIKRP